MPEDAIAGFTFKQPGTDPARTLSERLAEDIVQQSLMSRLDPAETASTTETSRAQEPALDWDGNVPPDFSEDAGFLF